MSEEGDLKLSQLLSTLSLVGISVLEADLSHLGEDGLGKEVQGKLPRNTKVSPLSVLFMPGVEAPACPEEHEGGRCLPRFLAAGSLTSKDGEDPRLDLHHVALAHEAFLDAEIFLVRPVAREPIEDASLPPRQGLRCDQTLSNLQSLIVYESA